MPGTILSVHVKNSPQNMEIYIYIYTHTHTHIYAHSVVQSCLTLYNPLWTVAHWAPLSMGFSKQESWSGLPCPPPGDLPNPRIEPGSSVLQCNSLPLSHQGKPYIYIYIYIYTHTHTHIHTYIQLLFSLHNFKN